MPALTRPLLQPLGERALVVRFGSALDDLANSRAIGLAERIAHSGIEGVEDVTPGLVSVLVSYDPRRIAFFRLSGEIALLADQTDCQVRAPAAHSLEVRYGGAAGPDLEHVAQFLGLSVDAFIAAHGEDSLRVLAIGFAPGFAYCGFHPEALTIPRRRAVRQSVPAGSILFAARQTAVAATEIPTGWHVIGRTATPTLTLDTNAANCLLTPGDSVRFEEAIS